MKDQGLPKSNLLCLKKDMGYIHPPICSIAWSSLIQKGTNGFGWSTHINAATFSSMEGRCPVCVLHVECNLEWIKRFEFSQKTLGWRPSHSAKKLCGKLSTELELTGAGSPQCEHWRATAWKVARQTIQLSSSPTCYILFMLSFYAVFCLLSTFPALLSVSLFVSKVFRYLSLRLRGHSKQFSCATCQEKATNLATTRQPNKFIIHPLPWTFSLHLAHTCN